MANYMGKKRPPVDSNLRTIGSVAAEKVARTKSKALSYAEQLRDLRSDVTYACGVINTLAQKHNDLSKRVEQVEKYRVDIELMDKRIDKLHARVTKLEQEKNWPPPETLPAGAINRVLGGGTRDGSWIDRDAEIIEHLNKIRACLAADWLIKEPKNRR